MAKARISKRTVDAVEAGTADVYLWDDELAGFGLKVTPAGRKVYLVQYRPGGRTARTRRVTLGQHGVLTPEEARVAARRLLGKVASGNDPAADRRAKAEAPTLGGLLDQFLDEHVAAKLKASTAGEYRRLARLYVTASLRRRPVGEVGRPEIAKLHLSLRDKPYQGNRTLALLSKFFNWCERHGLRETGTNPCRHVEKYREEQRDRFLTPAELARLGDALAASTHESIYVLAALRLLALTGARLSEILTLRWADVDIDLALIRLPDSKTGKKVIYLSEAALRILVTLPRASGNPYVIVGERTGAHLVNLQRPWRRIRRLARLDDVRIHDLRHSFASVAASGGQSLVIIGKLLGHTQPQTTARYAHLAADPIRAANTTISQQIADALGTGAAKPNGK